jgi:hypothetical protein
MMVIIAMNKMTLIWMTLQQQHQIAVIVGGEADIFLVCLVLVVGAYGKMTPPLVLVVEEEVVGQDLVALEFQVYISWVVVINLFFLVLNCLNMHYINMSL